MTKELEQATFRRIDFFQNEFNFVVEKINEVRFEFWFVFNLNFYDILTKAFSKCNTFKTWNLENEEKILKDFFYLTNFLFPEELLFMWGNLEIFTSSFSLNTKKNKDLKNYQVNRFKTILKQEFLANQKDNLFSNELIEMFVSFNATSGLSDLTIGSGRL